MTNSDQLTEGPVPQRRATWLSHPLLQIGCAGLLGVLVTYYGFLFRIAMSQHSNDFGKFYFAAQAWLDGGSLYAPNVATRMLVRGEWFEFLNMNPPHFHLIVLPVVRLDLATATKVWIALNVLAAGLSIAIAVRELGLKVRPAAVLPALVIALLSGALNAIAVTGQFTGLLMLPMTLAWRDARRGHWLRCGSWLGALIGLKPFLALFVPVLLVNRHWRALVGVATSILLTFAAGVTVFGWHAHVEWVRSLQAVSWTWSNMNASITGWLSRSLDVSPMFVPLAVMPSIVRPLWIAIALVVAAATLLASRRSISHAFAVTLLGSLLMSPLGWVYYVPLALAPCLELWRARRPPLAVVGIVLGATPLLVPSAFGMAGLAVVSLGSVYFWSVAALFSAVLWVPVDTGSRRDTTS